MALDRNHFGRIKAFVFDVDGVLSADMSPLDKNGDPLRTANVKDGFAIRTALTRGFEVAIITGGAQKRVRKRYSKLGVRYFYDASLEKSVSFRDFMHQTGFAASDILYMGDDLPDLPAMKSAGIAACPADAVPEILAASGCISEKNGGHGCVRDIIEQVLRAQGQWNFPSS